MDAPGKFFRRRRRRRRRRPPGFGMKMTTSRVLLRNWSFRSAQIDPSRRAVAEGLCYVIKKSYKKFKYPKRVGKRLKTAKNRHSIKIPYRNIPHSYPLKGAVM